MNTQSQPATATQVSWPTEPYKGFSYYTFEDALLFVGRDDDVDDCAAYLAEPKTRTFLLHGRTGCGKSSFLRAGLIPALESHGLGFVFLRRNEGERPVLIRCTADPITRLAEELFWFTSSPREYETAIGPRKIDISDARVGKNDVRAFAESCRDPEFLMGVLKAISGKLSHTLIIILDQAEEAITQNEGRSAFFDFLKLFNGAGLDVKLVIALRTESFGEFFGYLHFGASTITDVKQYFLQGLDRGKVKNAIELPTLKSPVGDHVAPFTVYGFEYEAGLVDTIVADLFSAPPSGGILPLMQVVCRRLYHEARDLAVPKIITGEMYRSGGGVVGRVDEQIGRSLRAAISSNRPIIRDVANEEARWRAGLYKLVRTQPDGTVGTDLKTEDDLRNILRDGGVTGDIPAMLAQLADTKVLILRCVNVSSADSDSEIVLYSLGHDAIGLVLRQWMLRFDEAERSQHIFKRRFKVGAGIAAVLLSALALFLAYTIGDSAKSQKMVEMDVLRSWADSQFKSNPRTAATAAIDASMIGESVLLRGQTGPLQSTLANIAATLPTMTVNASFVGQKRGLSGGMAFPVARKFLFWSADHGVEFVDWDGDGRTKLDPAALYGNLAAANASDRRPWPANLRDATEAPGGLFLLQFETVSGQEFISMVKNGSVAGVYDNEYLLNLSEEVRSHFDKPLPARAGALHVALDGNIVYLFRWSGRSFMTVAAFYVGNDGKFSIGALVSDQSPEGEEATASRRFMSYPPGIVFLLTYLPPPGLTSLDADLRRFGGMSAYNLRKKDGVKAWSLESSGNTTIKECVGRPETKRAETSVADLSLEACVFRPVDRGSSNFLAIMVPPLKRKPEPGNPEPTELRPEPPFSLVTIDVENGRTIHIDATAIMKGTYKAVFGPKAVPIDFRKVAVGGSFGSMVVAVPIVTDDRNAEVIDVFKMEGNQTQYFGTYASRQVPGRIFLAGDGQTMASVDNTTGRLWDISQSLGFTGPRLAADKSAAQLVKMICDSHLAEKVGESAWRDLMGLNSSPQPPCEK